jgi:hypothetical protein
MTKEELLKQVWKTRTFDEIIDAGFEYNKCSGEQLINAAAEFDAPENNDEDLIDKLKNLLESERKEALRLESIYYRSRKGKPFDFSNLAGC